MMDNNGCIENNDGISDTMDDSNDENNDRVAKTEDDSAAVCIFESMTGHLHLGWSPVHDLQTCLQLQSMGVNEQPSVW